MGNAKIDTELNILVSSLKAQISVLEAKIKKVQKPVADKKIR